MMKARSDGLAARAGFDMQNVNFHPSTLETRAKPEDG